MLPNNYSVSVSGLWIIYLSRVFSHSILCELCGSALIKLTNSLLALGKLMAYWSAENKMGMRSYDAKEGLSGESLG